MIFSEVETVEKQGCPSGTVGMGPENILWSSFLPSLLHKLVNEISPLRFDFMKGFMLGT